MYAGGDSDRPSGIRERSGIKQSSWKQPRGYCPALAQEQKLMRGVEREKEKWGGSVSFEPLVS